MRGHIALLSLSTSSGRSEPWTWYRWRTFALPSQAALSTSTKATKVSPNEVRLIVAFSNAAQISSRSYGVIILPVPVIESATERNSLVFVLRSADLTHSLQVGIHLLTRPRWLYTAEG